jgi:hypothetical protein
VRQARQCEKGRGAVALMWAATVAGLEAAAATLNVTWRVSVSNPRPSYSVVQTSQGESRFRTSAPHIGRCIIFSAVWQLGKNIFGTPLYKGREFAPGFSFYPTVDRHGRTQHGSAGTAATAAGRCRAFCTQTYNQ